MQININMLISLLSAQNQLYGQKIHSALYSQVNISLANTLHYNIIVRQYY